MDRFDGQFITVFGMLIHMRLRRYACSVSQYFIFKVKSSSASKPHFQVSFTVNNVTASVQYLLKTVSKLFHPDKSMTTE